MLSSVRHGLETLALFPPTNCTLKRTLTDTVHFVLKSENPPTFYDCFTPNLMFMRVVVVKCGKKAWVLYYELGSSVDFSQN